MCKKVLIIDDDYGFIHSFMNKYSKKDLSFSVADSLKRAKNLVKIDQYDYILANYNISGGNTLPIKEELEKSSPTTRMLFMSGIESDYSNLNKNGEKCYRKIEIDKSIEGIF